MKNYLPFATRNIIHLDGNEIDQVSSSLRNIKATSLTQFSNGSRGSRQILGDVTFSILPMAPSEVAAEESPYPYMRFTNNNIMVNIGYSGRGYLTSQRFPLGNLMNQGTPKVNVWKFPKPYRLFPGEQLRCEVAPMNFHGGFGDYPVNGAGTSTWFRKDFGVLFNAIRVKDNKPIVIYDGFTCPTRTADTYDANGFVYFPLNDVTLQCPKDSPIDIYSVTCSAHQYHEVTDIEPADKSLITRTWGLSARLKIFGPDNRPWFSTLVNQDAAATMINEDFIYGRFLNPTGCMLELGEERGWLQEAGEIFTASFENFFYEFLENEDTSVNVAVTLRGSMEVDHA